jgi:hypothetical protein
MKKRLINALDICLQSIDAGIPLEECIKKFPDLADELRDVLLTAEKVKQLRIEQIPADSMRLSESKLLLQISEYNNSIIPGHQPLMNRITKPLQQIRDSLRLYNPLTRKLILAICLAGVLILFSGGLIKTSAKSLPGEALYPVKRVVEDLTIYFAPNGEIRHKFEDSYSQQRVEEVNVLFTLSREQQISFEGVVTSIDDTQLNVSGVPVFIQSDTTIITGNPRITSLEPGMRVEVEGGTTKQGRVLADEIHLREYEFTGSIEKIEANNWQISGININIPSYIHIDGGIRVGDEVTVLIHSEDEGLYALSIRNDRLSIESPKEHQELEETPTPIVKSSYENGETFIFSGIINSIGINDWIIDGVVYQINGDSKIEENIKIGEKVSGLYRIEKDGSFVAIEIMPGENYDLHDERETPDMSDPVENLGTITPDEPDETEDSSSSPADEETPEPTENHLDPN